MSRDEAPANENAAEASARHMPDLRQAADGGLPAVLLASAAPTWTCNRWLTGRYAIPAVEDDPTGRGRPRTSAASLTRHFSSPRAARSAGQARRL